MRPLPQGNDSTHNGPSLLPIKQRLTPAQQFKRRVKQMKKGTRMEQLEGELKGTQNAVVNAFNAVARANKKRDYIAYTLHAVSLSGVGYLLAKVLGYL